LAIATQRIGGFRKDAAAFLPHPVGGLRAELFLYPSFLPLKTIQVEWKIGKRKEDEFY
jgi:hypothetical protein